MERETRIGTVNLLESAPQPKEDKFQKTIVFIEVAFAEGAHFKVPERNLDIALVYLLNPDETLEEIGKIYGGITKERVRQIKNKAMNNLWLNCSIETQTLFPFKELDLEKPLTQKSRERLSKAKGGKSNLVNRELRAGKSIGQIQKEKGLSTRQIASARDVLRERGTDVPYLITPHSKNLELEHKLRKANTDKEKQEFLNQVKRRFYHDHVKGDDPLLTTLTTIVLEAGLSLGFQTQNMAIFTESLKRENVRFPMGAVHERHTAKTGKEKILTHHFILAKDKERAKQILLADPNLQRFRRF